MKISILSQDHSPELEDLIQQLRELREQRLKEIEGSGESLQKLLLRNKREYIHNMFNKAISKIIRQRLNAVEVKIADLGNACFDVSGEASDLTSLYLL